MIVWNTCSKMQVLKNTRGQREMEVTDTTATPLLTVQVTVLSEVGDRMFRARPASWSMMTMTTRSRTMPAMTMRSQLLPGVRNRGEDDSLELLEWPWEFLAILPALMATTTSTFPMMTGPPDRRLVPRTPSEAATAS